MNGNNKAMPPNNVNVVPPTNPINISIMILIKIINAIVADKTAPSTDKIRPAIESPFIVFDLIKSKINKLIPSTDKNADGIKQSDSK